MLTIGFGDLVPMQKNNALSNDFTYVSFTILFILTGLTTLASSMVSFFLILIPQLIFFFTIMHWFIEIDLNKPIKPLETDFQNQFSVDFSKIRYLNVFKVE